MLHEDEDAVFGLRMSTWGAPDIDYVRRNAYTDPLYLQHTFVALDPDNTLLSTVSYRIQRIRDASGTPRKVGCVASVTTIESARRQGHASKLMQLAGQSMANEGCDYSLLFSSRMGVPLYETLGFVLYSAPYYLGTFSVDNNAHNAHTTHNYSIKHLEAPFDILDLDWQAIRNIYAAYNSHRSLSLVRDEAYWQDYFAPRLASSPTEDTTHVFLASSGDQPVAYLVSRFLATQSAQDFFKEDQGFMLREAAILPGHDAALPALISALSDTLAPSEQPLPGAAFLPREAAIEECLQTLFGQTLHLSGERHRMMVKPTGPNFTQTDLAATFHAPGALFSRMDIF